MRDAVFDTYQRLMPRSRASAPAVIVAIDERALDARGQWPWPRTLMAELLRGILAAGPAAVGVDGDDPAGVRLGRGDHDRAAEHGGHAERVDRAHRVGGGAARPGNPDRRADRGERVGRADLTAGADGDRVGPGELG